MLEDHRLFDAVQRCEEFGELMVDAEDLLYVHRRHCANVTAGRRQHMWQGVLPLQLAGEDASKAAALVRHLLDQPHSQYVEDA